MTPRVIETLRKNAKTVMQKTAKPAIVIAIVILLLVDAVIGSYFYSNLGDIINFSSFNPPVQEKLAYMTLSYPPIPPTSTLYVAGYSNSTVQFDTFTMTVLLRYNGTLAEGTPVIVLATCTFIRKNIALISIGFQGAEPYNATSAQLPYYMLLETVHESPRISDKNGNPSPNNDYWIEWQQNQNIPQLATIDWTWPGNYYPNWLLKIATTIWWLLIVGLLCWIIGGIAIILSVIPSPS